MGLGLDADGDLEYSSMRMFRFETVRSFLVGLRALAVLAALLGSASAIEAQTVVTLAWDPNTESNLAGYEVSYGTQSGVYSTIVDVGNVTSVPFTLPSGIVYYFAVKAYNSESPRQYSPYSAEVSTGVGTGGGSGGGGTFLGPGNGGPATGTVNASETQLTYNGATYPLVNGRVTSPDCTVYFALRSGILIPAGTASGCTPSGGGGGSAPTTPTITWANPASVTAGTVLGATQLNATASVAGTFVYSPAAGTVLTAGSRTLFVTFTPTATASYATASRSVTIVVTASGSSGGGSAFVGPSNGGPATGTVSAGETQLTYNGATYPIVNGKVTFPDCTVYIALRSGLLIPAGMAPGCTPGDR